MKNGTLLSIALLIMAILLSACGTTTPAQQETPTATVRPTHIPTNTVHYSTPLPTITDRSPIPTFPTRTLSPDELAYTATYSALDASHAAQRTAVAEFFVPGNDCQFANNFVISLISPDGNWMATDCPNKQEAQIIQRGGSSIRRIPYQTFLPADAPYEISDVSAVRWTNDSQYLYLIPHRDYGYSWDPSYLHLLLDRYDIYRWSVNADTVSIFLQGVYYYSFSPTDRRVVYISEKAAPVTLNIMDMTTREISAVELVEDPHCRQAAPIVWSPDGTRFVIRTAYGSEFFDDVSEPNRQSLILVDTINMTQTKLVDRSPDWIERMEWTAINILVFETYGMPIYTEPVTHFLDMNSLTYVTPIPPSP
jgi:hypothetical protein